MTFFEAGDIRQPFGNFDNYSLRLGLVGILRRYLDV
jgi:hypothetical protein